MDIPVADNAYRTKPGQASWFARRFPTLAFYPRLVRIVWSASRAAKRGYTTQRWVYDAWSTVRDLEAVGATVTVENAEVFAGLPPCVIIGNHMSTLETFVLRWAVDHQRAVTFVIKESLLHYPVFRHVMAGCNPITVGRTNPREDLKAVLDQGPDRLARGTSVIIFPQTTRSVPFDPSQFNSIGVKLARRAGVPVVPVALKTDVWGNGRWVKEFGRIDPSLPIRFCFGAPLAVQGSGRETHEAVVAFISGKMREWGVPVLSDSGPAKEE